MEKRDLSVVVVAAHDDGEEWNGGIYQLCCTSLHEVSHILKLCDERDITITLDWR